MTKTGPVSLEEVVELYNSKVEEIKQLKKENKELRQQIENLEKDKLDHVTMRERYRDNLLMDPLKCIHLKEIDKVLTTDG